MIKAYLESFHEGNTDWPQADYRLQIAVAGDHFVLNIVSFSKKKTRTPGLKEKSAEMR